MVINTSSSSGRSVSYTRVRSRATYLWHHVVAPASFSFACTAQKCNQLVCHITVTVPVHLTACHRSFKQPRRPSKVVYSTSHSISAPGTRNNYSNLRVTGFSCLVARGTSTGRESLITKGFGDLIYFLFRCGLEGANG